jgi:hypothetical protein
MSGWGTFDGLLRELGALRHDASGLDHAVVGEEVIAELDRLIANAAQALDGTIAEPDSDVLIAQARAAIGEARQRIQSLSGTASRSREIVDRSVELRDKASRLLQERLRREKDPR